MGLCIRALPEPLGSSRLQIKSPWCGGVTESLPLLAGLLGLTFRNLKEMGLVWE